MRFVRQTVWWGWTIASVAAAGTASTAGAQCPDGSLQKPCGGRVAPVPINPDRIAVLPFRVSSADPSLAYLGNGLVELLSAEFNGEVGPVAVEPGETLRGWIRAGAGSEPATQPVAIRVARGLGAGQVTMGAVIGIPRQFTVNASILNVPGGSTRGAPVQVRGSEDSLPAFVNELATRLLGQSTGVTGTTSNGAMRAYLAGMAAYRKRDSREAETQFMAAIRLDSTFMLPAYRMLLLRALFGPSQGVAAFRGSFRALWNRRQKLSVEQKTLVEAVADSTDMLFRMQALPRMDRAIGSLPNSAEAWDIIGDLYFHVGALIGRADWAEKSRLAFLRASALDATLCACAPEHLGHFAYLSGDARTLAKYPTGTALQRYEAALLGARPAAIHAARTEYAKDATTSCETPSCSGNNKLGRGLPEWLLGISLPIGEADSVMAELTALANTDEHRRALALWSRNISVFAGRPARAAEDARRAVGSDTALYESTLQFAEDDSLAAERLFGMLDVNRPAHRPQLCEAGLSRLRRGDTTGVSALLATLGPLGNLPGVDEFVRKLPDVRTARPGRERAAIIDAVSQAVCAEVLRGVYASLEPSGSGMLMRADSIMLAIPLNSGDQWNYDIALALGRRRQYAAAAATARRHWRAAGTGIPRLVVALRHEGRWAALAGDTAAATQAYRHYLMWRDSPEPALIPQRDSVRTELAALERPRKKR